MMTFITTSFVLVDNAESKRKEVSSTETSKRMGERELGKQLVVQDLVAGKSELVGHSKSSGHLRQSNTSQDSHHMRVFFAMTNASTIKAELNTVALVARKNIPFNAVDILLPPT